MIYLKLKLLKKKNMNEGTLITCPNNLVHMQQQVLGSIDSSGTITYIKRFNGKGLPIGTTILYGQFGQCFSIGCPCGYKTELSKNQGTSQLDLTRQ